MRYRVKSREERWAEAQRIKDTKAKIMAGSTPALNREQIEILDHTEHIAALRLKSNTATGASPLHIFDEDGECEGCGMHATRCEPAQARTVCATADAGEAREWRKKPVVITAMQFNGDNYEELRTWANSHPHPDMNIQFNVMLNADLKPVICTTEGVMMISKGDYVICGIKGEFYPCKPDIFESTYEDAAALSATDAAPAGMKRRKAVHAFLAERYDEGFKATIKIDACDRSEFVLALVAHFEGQEAPNSMKQQLEQLMAKWEHEREMSGHNDSGKEFTITDHVKEIRHIIGPSPLSREQLDAPIPSTSDYGV